MEQDEAGPRADEDGGGRETGPPRQTRRLSDKILLAFHQACDQGDVEVAGELIRVLELMVRRRPLALEGNRRRKMEGLVAAHERLWAIRHPDA